MTTTIQFAEKMEKMATTYRINLSATSTPLLFESIAQRLRELDKPDCIYTRCADDSPTPNTLESGCGGAMWYLGDDGKGDHPKFCHHCQGAVREAV